MRLEGNKDLLKKGFELVEGTLFVPNDVSKWWVAYQVIADTTILAKIAPYIISQRMTPEIWELLVAELIGVRVLRKFGARKKPERK